MAALVTGSRCVWQRGPDSYEGPRAALGLRLGES